MKSLALFAQNSQFGEKYLRKYSHNIVAYAGKNCLFSHIFHEKQKGRLEIDRKLAA
jgi:hypothetical protein